jgi:plasmid stability protein
MDDSKRATVYFEAEVHQALRIKAAAADRSISDVVNEAVKIALAEDAEDLAAFQERKTEKSVSFESFVRGLRQRGRI